MVSTLTKPVSVLAVAIALSASIAFASPAQAQSSGGGDISALTALINSLQAQLNALIGGGGGGTSNPPSSSQGNNGVAVGQQSISFCPAITRNLRKGSRDVGADRSVSELQTFLSHTGDYSYGEITGFFGAATEAAVQKFQCREMGICSGSSEDNGYGFVGPKTRAKIADICGTHGNVGGGTSGGIIACTLDAKICPDGSAVGRVGPKCEFAACPGTGTGNVACPQDAMVCPDGSAVGRSGPNCEFAACPSGGQTSPPSTGGGNGGVVTPTPPIACTQIYAPVCGIPPGCANGGGNGIYQTMMCAMNKPQTYGSTCTANASEAMIVYQGECVADPVIANVAGPTSSQTGHTATWSFTATGNGFVEQSIELWKQSSGQGVASNSQVKAVNGSSMTYTFSSPGTYQVVMRAVINKGASGFGNPSSTYSLTVHVQ